MINWNDTDTLSSYRQLAALKGRVDLKQALSGENGARRSARLCPTRAARTPRRAS